MAAESIQNELRQRDVNRRPGLGRVQEQLVSGDAAALQRHTVPDPQSAVTEQQDERPDAADISRRRCISRPDISFRTSRTLLESRSSVPA